MKKVVVFLHPDTATLEVALQWPFLSPIGPRLEKTLPMPDIPTRGYTDLAAALEAGRKFDDWLVRQENGERGVFPTHKAVEVKPVEKIDFTPSPVTLTKIVEQHTKTPPPITIAPPVVRPAPPVQPQQEDLFTGTF